MLEEQIKKLNDIKFNIFEKEYAFRWTILMYIFEKYSEAYHFVRRSYEKRK